MDRSTGGRRVDDVLRGERSARPRDTRSSLQIQGGFIPGRQQRTAPSFMADGNEPRRTLGDPAARQLANTTKTNAQLGTITPRWLVNFLTWTPVESGTYRVNRVKDSSPIEVACGQRDESELPQSFLDYEQKAREHTLRSSARSSSPGGGCRSCRATSSSSTGRRTRRSRAARPAIFFSPSLLLSFSPSLLGVVGVLGGCLFRLVRKPASGARRRMRIMNPPEMKRRKKAVSVSAQHSATDVPRGVLNSTGAWSVLILR